MIVAQCPAGDYEPYGSSGSVRCGAGDKLLGRRALRGNLARGGVELGLKNLNLPNMITIARILLVPVVVWAIASGKMRLAFALFVAAGLSDAIDGFLAKRLRMTSEVGAYLDPLADKALIMSIYVALGITEAIPGWLVILVVSRDIMIIGAVMLSWLVGKPVKVRPHPVSKLNTVAQILFATLVLAAQAFEFDAGRAGLGLMLVVAALTLASVAFYVRDWMRHVNASEKRN